ncbi:MAG: CUB domain-containing protein [Candidatus Parabeggiatoa sp.]|nr:CUB domain-containing protein [Candidatus Parabeggiatoa sp.]
MMMALSSFIQIQGLILMGLISTVIAIPANAQSPTLYAIGQYADPPKEQYPNNLNKSKVLSIPGANELEVSIIGKIEKCCQSDVVTTRCCDYLTLYDSQNKEIGKYSGEMKKQFTVKGASIRVDFKSDGRTTDKGFKIKISHPLPATVYNVIKEKLLVASHLFLELGTEEAYAKISKNVQALKDLQAKMQQIPETDAFIEQVANELMLIAQTYNEVAAMNLWIMNAYQEQFDILKGLKQETQYQIHQIKLQIHQIKLKKQGYKNSLDQTQTQLEDTHDNLEQQMMQLSMAGYESIIPSLHDQQESWNKFDKLQDTLEDKLRLHSNYIRLFLHTLGINGQNYQEFAQATLMRQKTILTLSQTIQFPQFCDNLAKMIKNERDIIQWIKKIEHSEWNVSQ